MSNSAQITTATSTTSNTQPTLSQKSKSNSPRDKKNFTQRSSGQRKRFKKSRFGQKKTAPKPKAAPRGPVRGYVSDCCKAQAKKPQAATKRTQKDPESGKFKDVSLGLGKWRCTNCGKRCKVTVTKPFSNTPDATKLVTVDMAAVEERAVGELINNVQ